MYVYNGKFKTNFTIGWTNDFWHIIFGSDWIILSIHNNALNIQSRVSCIMSQNKCLFLANYFNQQLINQSINNQKIVVVFCLKLPRFFANFKCIEICNTETYTFVRQAIAQWQCAHWMWKLIIVESCKAWKWKNLGIQGQSMNLHNNCWTVLLKAQIKKLKKKKKCLILNTKKKCLEQKFQFYT